MGKKVFLRLSVLLLVFLYSCGMDKEDLYKEKPETYTDVVINLGGEVIVGESPLSRADGDDDLYGIQINQSATQNGPWVKYSYIIYDKSTTELTVNLLDDYYYQFQGVMVKNGKNICNEGNDEFSRPFTIDSNSKVNGKLTKGKFLTSLQVDGSYNGLYSIFNSSMGHQENLCNRPNVLKYCGSYVTTEKINGGNPVIDLKLWKRFFAVQYTAQGLQSDYQLNISLDDSPVVTLQKSKLESDEIKLESDVIYYSFSSNGLSANIDPNRIYQDNARFIVSVSKIGEPNAKPDTIYNYNISFKRNYLHKIRISDIDHFGTNTSINVIVDDDSQEIDEFKDLPWQSETGKNNQ